MQRFKMCISLRKLRLLFVLICTVSAGLLYSQEEYLHFNVGSGLHDLSSDALNGGKSMKFNYSINACYSYFFPSRLGLYAERHWGIQTGIGLQSFGLVSTQNGLSETPDIDTDGDNYTFRIKYNNWKEEQQLLYVTIPVALQYKVGLGVGHKLITSVGLKLALPVIHKYKAEGGKFSTTGYYEKWNLELYDLPQHGFSTFTGKSTGNLFVRPTLFTSADIGDLIKISKFVDLYIGAYVDYGLTNTLKLTDKHWTGTYKGLFASSEISSVKPIAFGLKMGVYINSISIIKRIKQGRWE